MPGPSTSISYLYKKSKSYIDLAQENKDMIDNVFCPAEYFAHHLIYQTEIQTLTEPKEITTPFGTSYTAYPIKSETNQAGLMPCLFISNDDKSTPREVRIVFRGTGCLNSVIRDLDAGAKTLAADAEAIMASVNTILSEQKIGNTRLIVSGHSLGGADAFGLTGYVLDEIASRKIARDQPSFITERNFTAFDQITHVNVEAFNSARLSKEMVDNINNVAARVSDYCPISAHILLAEGDTIQRTGYAYPFITHDENNNINTQLLKVKHKSVYPISESLLNIIYLPQNTKRAHTAKYLFNNFFPDDAPLKSFQILNNKKDLAAMKKTANGPGITENFIVKSIQNTLNSLMPSPISTPITQTVSDESLTERFEMIICSNGKMITTQLNEEEKNNETLSKLIEENSAPIIHIGLLEEKSDSSIELLKAMVIESQPAEKDIIIPMISPKVFCQQTVYETSEIIRKEKVNTDEKHIIAEEKETLAEQAYPIICEQPRSEILHIINDNKKEKIDTEPTEQKETHTEQPKPQELQLVDNIEKPSEQPSVIPEAKNIVTTPKSHWYENLSKNQKLSLAVGIGLTVTVLGVLTGGLLFAGIAGVSAAATLATLFGSFSSITSAGVITLGTTTVTTPIIAGLTYKKLISTLGCSREQSSKCGEPKHPGNLFAISPINARDYCHPERHVSAARMTSCEGSSE